MNAARTIVHVDMDAFYASVEQLDNPELRGKPLIVGGTGRRGVVAAASYEVRRFGVRSAMPVKTALKRCPNAICVAPRMPRYQQVSAQIFAIFREFTPLVEGLSLDEAFLDVSASLNLFGGTLPLGREIKARILAHTGLTASVGIAPNKLVAKIASEQQKPDGLCHVTAEGMQAFLDPLSVSAMWGIGRRAAQTLSATGIRTLGDLRVAPEGALQPAFGRYASRFRDRAAGMDDRVVQPWREDKSISAEETFATDIGAHQELHAHLAALADKVSSRVRRKALHATLVRVKIRSADFHTETRQSPLQPPSHESMAILNVAAELLRNWLQAHPGAEIRLLGVGTAEFRDARQLHLFGAEDRTQQQVDAAVDRIRDRFGAGMLQRGNTLRR